MSNQLLEGYKQAAADEISLADKLVSALSKGRSVQIFFDNDGTTFPFTADPSQVKMDPDCFRGLVRLSQFPSCTAISVTGRDVRLAAEQMLTPGYEVKNVHGKVIVQQGDKTPRFAVIGSHGVEKMTPDGQITRYNFAPQVDAFISDLKNEAQALTAQYPGLFVETDKHGAVGINAKLVQGDEQTKQAAFDAAKKLLARYEASAQNPIDHSGARMFAIRSEGAHELEFRPVSFGKDFGIAFFGNYDRDALTIFMCDSLGDHGTDRAAAALINNKAAFTDGHVIMVRNGRDAEPAAHLPHAPKLICDSPAHLGAFLNQAADTLEIKLNNNPKPNPLKMEP